MSEKENMPPSTTEILAWHWFGRGVDDRWIEWAVSMLVAGKDSPSLRVLAGECPPFNQFEMAALVGRVLEELALAPFSSSEEAAHASVTVLARRIVEGSVDVCLALREMADLCIELEYPKGLYDFYLLYFARQDLTESEVQWYWPGADRENIDQLILEQCSIWLKAHPPIDPGQA